MASSDSDPASAAPASRADRPVIGVTTYLEQARTGVWDVRASFLPATYLHAVTEAGGIPVLLPPQPCNDGQAAAALARLDALILTGGADVDPGLYGQEPHPATGAPRHDRDAWELALLAAARASGLPLLAICRGMQLVAAAGGGTLRQHLPDEVGDERYQPGAGIYGSGEIDVDADSRLAGIVGTERHGVPVYHHQGVDRVPDGMRVTARTADGVIQALEPTTDGTFCVAVQWHPEEQREDRRLFAALVAAAAAHRDAPTQEDTP